VLASQDERERVPMASITKLMTALVALEHASLDDVARSRRGPPRSASRRSTSVRASA
jgi:D-alanyl-D-alanine carboxypeptidase